MGEWSFLNELFEGLNTYSSMLGRFWLLLVLVFRIVILGTVASDLFSDEQEEFTCNTLQPGCKQVCYDEAIPISQYRFWVFHIVLISTPSLLFLVYAMHHRDKKSKRSGSSQSGAQQSGVERNLRRLYIINVVFRMVAEAGFLVAQWWLYGFKVESQIPCSRFPCPHTVDCFTSRPAEKTVFLCFYFVVGVISLVSSSADVLYGSRKWFCSRQDTDLNAECSNQNHQNMEREQGENGEKAQGGAASEGVHSGARTKRGSLRGSGGSSAGRKGSSVGHKHRNGEYVSTRTLMV